jgi:hypothetical protein
MSDHHQVRNYLEPESHKSLYNREDMSLITTSKCTSLPLESQRRLAVHKSKSYHILLLLSQGSPNNLAVISPMYASSSS